MAERSRPTPAPAPVAASPFSRLALAHAFSVGADAIVTVALAGSLFFSISPQAAQGRVTLSLILTMAPFAVVAPFVGPTIDRMRGGRRLALALAAFGRVVSCLWMAEVVHGLLLFPAAFATLVLSKAHAVAKSSLVPAVVGNDELLVDANAKLSLGGGISGVVAAGPAVALLQLAGPEWALRFAALVFCVTGVAALRISTRERDRVADRAGRAAGDEELHQPAVRLAATAMGLLRGGVGFLTFLVAFSFRRDGAPSWWFGVVLIASVAGSILGAVAAPRLRARVREETMLIGALLAVTMAGLFAARLQGRPAAAMLAGVMAVAASTGKLAFDSLVQRDAPDAVHGRSFARFETMFQLVWVAGALLPVVLTVPDRVGYFVLSLGAAMAAFFYGAGRRTLARPR